MQAERVDFGSIFLVRTKNVVEKLKSRFSENFNGIVKTFNGHTIPIPTRCCTVGECIGVWPIVRGGTGPDYLFLKLERKAGSWRPVKVTTT